MIPENTKNDFSKGSVVKNIVSLALPMTLAQLINILYNIVDRMYIGRIPEHATLSLTGLGLSMPIITVVIAFANLFGMGGAPLCSIARGKGDTKGAEKIVGNAFTMLLCTGLLLTIIGLLFKKPLLYAFGASDATFPFADSYLSIYLLGSVFVTVSLGMNSYINAQGFARVGMVTTLIGAVLNIILDPFFYFYTGYGNSGGGNRHRYLTVRFRSLDRAIPYQPEGHPAHPCILYASLRQNHPRYHHSGAVQFHDGNHQQYCAGGM